MPKGQKFKTMYSKASFVCEACNKQFSVPSKRFVNKMSKLHFELNHKGEDIVEVNHGTLQNKVPIEQANVIKIAKEGKLNITSIKKL